MTRGAESRRAVRRGAIVALVLAALLAGGWFLAGGGSGPQRAPSAPDAEQGGAPRAPVELAEADVRRPEPPVRAEAGDGASAAPEPAAASADEPAAEVDALAFVLDAEPAVVDVRHEPAGSPGTQFVLEIEHHTGIPAADRSLVHATVRQPAFLELDALWVDADDTGAPARRETRRMVGDIEMWSWWFAAGGLAPGLVTWRVDLGVCGAFGGRTRLESGRTVVVVDLARIGGDAVVEHVLERFVPDDTWRTAFRGAELAFEELVNGAESQRPAPDDDLALVEFRRCEPWVELVDADGARLAGFPLEVLGYELVPGLVDVLDSFAAPDSLATFGVGSAVGLRVVAGVPRPFVYETDHRVLADGSLRFEAALTAHTPPSSRFGVLRLDLGAAEQAPTEVTLCFHGAHSRYLAPLAVARRVATRIDGERRVLAERIDLATLPLPLRVMVGADGCAPEFFDLEELLDPERTVAARLEPGSGGVVVGAYENNPSGHWHFTPARGFDVEWHAGAEAGSAALEVARLGSLGFFEFRSTEARVFDAAHLALGDLEPNLLRETLRGVGSDLAVRFDDVAPGVVELWIHD
jgi:hypothetical protein